MSTPSPPPGVTHVPSPWTLRADVYVAYFHTSPAVAANLPSKTYSPLEASSSFADSHASGKALGGLSNVQLIRYHDTPVGPYDEMILIPGQFEYPKADGDVGKGAKGEGKKMGKGLRVTRIYVSQERTTWNGRYNWNIPKHLARFSWTTSPSGILTVAVYPHDHTTPYSTTETTPSASPFFTCSFHPIPYLPSFPSSTSLLRPLLDMSLYQPPLPSNPDASKGELVGTDRWVRCVPYEGSWKTKVGWVDMRQEGGTESGEENFWPGVGRWVLGTRMLGAKVLFETGEEWRVKGNL